MTDPREEGCLCRGCGRRYRVDVVVPDPLWERIRPPGPVVEAGLLCGSCVMERIEALGEFDAYGLISLAKPPEHDRSCAGRGGVPVCDCGANPSMEFVAP